ncbi:hypothetical protein HU200_065226 [Digitaria exilis]|uniref:Uncharacterized protein n=1 Tax=Digitaria exilis TaxID=1010633 RepID=A0A835A0E6_9POAL|nr:hypothetical protein HU200_065226 [Digitaria exilis]
MWRGRAATLAAGASEGASGPAAATPLRLARQGPAAPARLARQGRFELGRRLLLLLPLFFLLRLERRRSPPSRRLELHPPHFGSFFCGLNLGKSVPHLRSVMDFDNPAVVHERMLRQRGTVVQYVSSMSTFRARGQFGQVMRRCRGVVPSELGYGWYCGNGNVFWEGRTCDWEGLSGRDELVARFRRLGQRDKERETRALRDKIRNKYDVPLPDDELLFGTILDEYIN